MITRIQLEHALTMAREVTVFSIGDGGVTSRFYAFDGSSIDGPVWQVYSKPGDGVALGKLLPGYDALARKLTGKHAEKHGKLFLRRSDAVHAYRQSLVTRIAALQTERTRLEILLRKSHAEEPAVCLTS